MNKEDTNINKEGQNRNKLPVKNYGPESARQLDVRYQQPSFFIRSIDSNSYKLKVVLPPYVTRAMQSPSSSSYPRTIETMKSMISMKTHESKLNPWTPKYNSFPRIKDIKYFKHEMFKMNRNEDENITQRRTHSQPYKKFYIKEKNEQLGSTISPNSVDLHQIHHYSETALFHEHTNSLFQDLHFIV